jgi:hypothetical protein
MSHQTHETDPTLPPMSFDADLNVLAVSSGRRSWFAALLLAARRDFAPRDLAERQLVDKMTFDKRRLPRFHGMKRKLVTTISGPSAPPRSPVSSPIQLRASHTDAAAPQ